MARANEVAGRKTECKKYIELANKAGEQIKTKGDKDYLFSEIRTIKC